MTYIVYHTRYNKEPVFYGVFDDLDSATSFALDLFEREYERKLPVALKYVEQWLNDLSEAEPCDYAPCDIVVQSRYMGEIFYDTEEDFLADLERMISGLAISGYMQLAIPRYEVGQVIEV